MLRIGKIRLVSAEKGGTGHEYPFIADENQVFTMHKDPHGAFCGAFEGLEYEDYEIKISKGGGIFLYTDGVAEAKRSDDKMFETGRIERCLNAHPSLYLNQSLPPGLFFGASLSGFFFICSLYLRIVSLSIPPVTYSSSLSEITFLSISILFMIFTSIISLFLLPLYTSHFPTWQKKIIKKYYHFMNKNFPCSRGGSPNVI
ncbi:MAG: SpoIIE family protein phosphatase [Butyrivibrio sp.]|nr:SpoIIE family protein phosphatase [Butyrivibrio sp.]